MKSKYRGKHLSRSGGGYFRRLISLMLCLSMLMSLFNGAAVLTARAAESVDPGLCDHHTRHDAYCGYVEAVAGHPCEYECLECKYAEVLRKMEEDYERDGTLPPAVIHDPNAYLEGIAPLAFSTNGHISWDYFTVAGQPVTEETWFEDAAGVDPQGYRVDGRGVLPSKFPSYPDVHFANLSINSVEVVRIGILESNTGGADAYYYMTLTHQTGTSGPPEVSATLLKDGEKFQVNYAADEYNIDYQVWLVTGEVDATTPGAVKVGLATLNDDGTEKETETYYYTYTDVTEDDCPFEDPDSQWEKNWRHNLFRGTNASSTTNGAVSFDVTIPYGYTAWVLCYFPDEPGRVIDLTGPRGDITNSTVRNQRLGSANGGYPLGWEPVYQYDGSSDKVTTTEDGPATMKVNGTFYSDAVTEDRQVVVVLKENKDAPVFDARYWVRTANAGGQNDSRGTVGYDKNDDRDIDTWDSWGWHNPNEWNKPLKEVTPAKVDPDAMSSTKYSGNVYYMWEHKNNNDDGDDGDDGDSGNDDSGNNTYDFIWTFQTNSSDSYLLDSLELNGTSLEIPLFPGMIGWQHNGYVVPEIADPSKCTSTTILPDGAVVELTYLRAWKGTNNNPQRAYTLKITGATTNITVTGGNLMQFNSGAAEFIPGTITGVTADRKDGSATFRVHTDKGWETKPMSKPVVLGSGNTNIMPDENGFNISFQLVKGYENPTFSWVDERQPSIGTIASGKAHPWSELLALQEAGQDPDPNAIYGPDSEGYYYLCLDKMPEAKTDKVELSKVLFLNITASLKKYMVRYIVNDNAPNDYFNAPADWEENVSNMPYYPTDPDKWGADKDELLDALQGHYINRYDDRGGQFYDAISGATVAISDAVPEHDTKNQDEKKNFLFWAVVDAEEKVVYQTVEGKVEEDGESPTGWVAIVTEKSEDGITTTRTVPVLVEGEGENQVLYPIDTESYVPTMGKAPIDKENGKDADGNDVTPTGYLLSSIKKLAYKVYPNGTLDLRTYQNYAAAGDESIGGADSNYYALRLKAVWGDTPASFRYYIRLVYTDAQTGQTNLLSFVQDVTTEWDEKINEDGVRPVGVNTSDDIFVDWLKQYPQYAFDEVRNTTVHADSDGWEYYPDGIGGLLDEDPENSEINQDAHYRIDGNYVFSVENGGLILIYMKLQNGTIPIAKKIYGSPRGEDPFTYSVKATLMQQDINAANGVYSDLVYMLPVGTYYGWPDTDTETSVGIEDGYTQPSAPVEVKFTRHTGGNHHGALKEDCPVCTTNQVDAGVPGSWYSEATFTLEGGQAILLNVPQSKYEITETNAGEHDVFVNGDNEHNVKNNPTVNRDVFVGKTSDPVLFENHAQTVPVSSVPVVSKEIVDSSGYRVTDQDGTFTFELKPQGNYGNKVELLKKEDDGTLKPAPLTSATLEITTVNGFGKESYDGIQFNYAGIYEFLITETAVPTATPEGASYLPKPGSHIWRVVVVNKDGKLTLDTVSVDGKTVSGATAPVEFTNLYIEPPKPGEVQVFPTVYKELVGRSQSAGEFKFVMTARPQEGMTLPANTTATNSADGSVTFEPIIFDKEGTYEVQIKENIPDGAVGLEKDGVVYDNKTITITYTVTEGSDGKLVATASYSDDNKTGDDNTFTNQAYADGSFTVKKDYNTSNRAGNTWNANEVFHVVATLTSADGEVGFNARNSGSTTGDVYAPMYVGESRTRELTPATKESGDTFDFRFYGEGTYVFSVYEVYNSLPGVSYDAKNYTVTFTVTASGATLAVKSAITQNGKPVNESAITFENVYRSDRVEIPLRAMKTLQGGTMTADQFRFVLEDSKHTVISSGYNDASGNVVFTHIFRTVGRYTYYMKEDVGTDDRIIYDDTVYTVSIVVGLQDGAPVATVTYYKGEEVDEENQLKGNAIPTFTNEMKAPNTLVVTNTVVDEEKDPTKEFTFTFTFENKGGQAITGQAFPYTVTGPVTNPLLNRNIILPAFTPGGGTGGIMPLFTPGSAAMTGTIMSGQNIELLDGQKVTIELPAGVVYSYTVVESGYSPYTVSNDHGTGDTASGSLEASETIVNFTNTKAEDPPPVTNPETGSLTIRTTVTGNAGDTTKDFTFTVTLSDTTINGVYGDIEFKDGTASFTLKHGESKTANGLPAGITYTVTESDNAGYTVTSTGARGTIVAAGAVTAAFTNSKSTTTPSNPGTTSVTVRKVWEDNNSEARPGSVTVRLYRNGTPYGDPVTLDEANNWSHTWTDLSDSYTWTVDEPSVPDGYVKSVTHTGTTWTITNSLDGSDPDNPPDNVPQTGDNSHLGLWVTLMILSTLGMLGMGFFSNKKSALFSFNGRYKKK